MVVRYWQILHHTEVACFHLLSTLSSPIQLCMYDFLYCRVKPIFCLFMTITSASIRFFYCSILVNCRLHTAVVAWMSLASWDVMVVSHFVSNYLGNHHVHSSLVGSHVVNYQGTPLKNKNKSGDWSSTRIRLWSLFSSFSANVLSSHSVNYQYWLLCLFTIQQCRHSFKLGCIHLECHT